MCEWKSHRARPHFQSNDDASIKRLSSQVLDTTDEKRRIDLLNSLNGVGIPMGSAILMLTDPQHYGVIDVRVWSLLYAYGEVKSNPSGRNLSPNNWLTYLGVIRKFASEFKVKPRDIDRTLFLHGRSESRHGPHY